MAITFPTSPTTGQAYTVGDLTWTYDGAKWKGQSVTATNLAGGSAGTLPYQSAANTTAQLAAGTSGYILKSTGAGAPVWGNDLAAKASLTGVETLTNKTLTGPVFGGAALENAYLPASNFAGYTFYATTNGAVQFPVSGNATANGALNITSTASQNLNTLMATNQVMTVSFVIQNGATPYYPTSITIDGSAPSILRWSGGTAPTAGNANSHDIYTFTIVKTGSPAWVVWASQTKFA